MAFLIAVDDGNGGAEAMEVTIGVSI